MKSKAKILVVDDEPDMRESCQDVLISEEMEVVTEGNARSAAKRLENERFDLLLTDLMMPEMDGLALLEHAGKVSPETIVVMITGFPTVETAVGAVRRGAFDYIAKPFSPDQLRAVVRRAVSQKILKDENLFLRREVEKKGRVHEIIGKSGRMKAIFRLIEQVSSTDSDVLIVGESGTGKELIARSLHAEGNRRSERFVPIDCGAIPESLLENELFGHEKGAFTGAERSSLGLLEYADGGVLFLDEICELPLGLQAKLLRVLQERQFRKIGGNRTVDVDIQVIAATNRNIQTEVKERRFREDLFYRIDVVRIEAPPLRERVEDIPFLADYFLEQYQRRWGKPVRGLGAEVMDLLRRYPWPGNVRELQNVMKRAVVLCGDREAKAQDLPEEIRDFPREGGPLPSPEGFFALRERETRSFEKQYLSDLLARHGGDVVKAAEEAGIPRGTLYRLLKKHRLRPDRVRSPDQ